jgi:hypothetical protein
MLQRLFVGDLIGTASYNPTYNQVNGSVYLYATVNVNLQFSVAEVNKSCSYRANVLPLLYNARPDLSPAVGTPYGSRSQSEPNGSVTSL